MLNVLAHAWHGIVIGLLDRWIADDLPLTAGEWLEHQLRARGLDGRLRVVTSEARTNGYAPWERVIHLSETTYFKRDPLYWAIAAHELGHARFELDHPRAARAVRAKWPRKLATAVGFGLLFGNILFARHDADRVAFACLAAALALSVLPLVEEAVASTYAFAALRASKALTRGHVASALVLLIAAFLTYATLFAGYAYLMTRWDEVERVTGDGRAPSGGLTLVGKLAMIGWTLVFAVRLLAMLGRRRASLARVLTWFAAPSIVWLAWDAGRSGGYQWCVLLAFVVFADWLVFFVMLPGTIVYVPLRALASRLGGGVDRTEALMTARAAGRVTVLEGNRWWKELKSPTTATDALVRFAPLLALPLLVAFWAYWLTS